MSFLWNAEAKPWALIKMSESQAVTLPLQQGYESLCCGRQVFLFVVDEEELPFQRRLNQTDSPIKGSVVIAGVL